MTTDNRFLFKKPTRKQTKVKDFRPSSNEALVIPADRPHSVAAFDTMAAKRPLKPPTKNWPSSLAK